MASNEEGLIDECIAAFTQLCLQLKDASDDKLAAARDKLNIATGPNLSANSIIDAMVRKISNIAEESKCYLIDFTLSHDDRNIEDFTEQITNFILMYCSCGHQSSHSLNTINTDRLTKLLKKTTRKRNKALVRDFHDFIELFKTRAKDNASSYIVVQLILREDKIKYDALQRSKCQLWHLHADIRNAITVRAVYSALSRLLAADRPIEHTDLMPIVYSRLSGTDDGWQSSDFGVLREGHPKTLSATFPAWIRKDSFITGIEGTENKRINLYTFLHKECPRLKLGEHLGNYVVYYLVVHDTQFESCEHECQHSAYQIYIGKAQNGVGARWLTAPNSHCKNAMLMVNEYDESRDCADYWHRLNLSGIPLADAYLMLAKLNRYDVALFVVHRSSTGKKEKKKKKNEEEKMDFLKSMSDGETDLIIRHDATNMTPPT